MFRNPIALLVVAAVVITAWLYLRANASPTVYTIAFLVAAGAAAILGSLVPRRSASVALLAFTATGSCSFGIITLSGFGYILLGLAGAALLATWATLSFGVGDRPDRLAIGLLVGALAGVGLEAALFWLSWSAASP